MKIPYASAVCSLMYTIFCTRRGNAHAVSVVSMFLSNPSKEHQADIKWILSYLGNISRFCLCYGNRKTELSGYLAVDYASDVDSRKSTSSYMMTFVGGVVSRQSRLQKCIVLSTSEVELLSKEKRNSCGCRNFYKS